MICIIVSYGDEVIAHRKEHLSVDSTMYFTLAGSALLLEGILLHQSHPPCRKPKTVNATKTLVSPLQRADGVAGRGLKQVSDIAHLKERGVSQHSGTGASHRRR